MRGSAHDVVSYSVCNMHLFVAGKNRKQVAFPFVKKLFFNRRVRSVLNAKRLPIVFTNCPYITFLVLEVYLSLVIMP